MKNLLAILSALMLAVTAVSCSHGRSDLAADTLYRVECFYQMYPDSALRILDTLDVDALSAKERVHYCLLKAGVKDMMLQNDAETDSLLQEAFDYLIGGRDKYYEAMAYMALARQYGLNGEGIQTILDCRLKALQSIGQCRHVD